MTYEYKCEKCEKEYMIIKPISKSERVELCPTCKKPMQRVWSSGIKTLDGVKLSSCEAMDRQGSFKGC